MEKSNQANLDYPWPEYIGPWRKTWGSETSQYPEEDKIIMIPLVVASETGRA